MRDNRDPGPHKPVGVAAALARDRLVPEPLLLSARAAARLYGVSEATWHRMVSAGRVPASVRPSPGCVRWNADELRAHIAAGLPHRREWEGRTAASDCPGKTAR
jgi:predicted DNA-binding transcriptional regulator AlpA